ncbi:hypothetical protein OK18_02020 [Chryseobacterium gallinarum]|uniref:Uncharacterized protein n=1 Tax=Chryseobacterium gallinarum TaxID=1324352 RepID=A0A0G3M0S5_CHRGL|nr:AHH domain-containing protein [Chryseobacterium gallinarum]AKK71578.1 hypothetical protein OK18_02020 [Chryseobacterium gallinarum]
MKKNFLILMGLVLSLLFSIQSCRNESFALEQEQEQHFNKNIAVLNKKEFESKLPLYKEVEKLKNNFFRQTTATAKTPQDPILDGAIIETDHVLEITDGTKRTYTIPVSRTFPNSIIENLVLRENSDNTYSGALIQYNLTKEEKDRYMNGEPVNLTGKIKSYVINNLSITGRGSTYSYYEGCWEYVYETNPCTAGGNHEYGDGSCTALGTGQAAQPAQIIAAYNHCGDGGDGGGGGSTGGGSTGGGSTGGGSTGGGSTGGGSTGGGSTGGGSTGGGSTGGGSTGGSGGGSGGVGGGYIENPTNPYNTFIFQSFDDMFNMCAEGDSVCEAERQLDIQVQQYLLSLNHQVSSLAAYNGVLFTIKDYFRIGGSGDDFLTQNLTNIASWFNTQNNTDTTVKLNNFKFANFTLKFLINNPDVSWEQFQRWFIQGYEYGYRNKLTSLSTDELTELVNVNKEIEASPYEEEVVKETNEAFVAFTSYADVESMTDAQIENVLNQCCPSIIIVPQHLIQEKTKMIVANYKFNRKFYPEWSKAKCFWEASRETIQLLLDLGGLVPVIGEVCDITNGVIYTIQGDGLNASLSYASAIPIAGWFASGSKFGVKVMNASDIASRQLLKWVVGTDGLIKFGYSSQLRKVLKLTDVTKQAHHIIPWAYNIQTHPIVQKAAKSMNAFHLNEALNGIAVASWRNQPNHNLYNNRIFTKLEQFKQLNPNATPNQCYDALMDIINDARQAIINNPNTHLNDLVF